MADVDSAPHAAPRFRPLALASARAVVAEALALAVAQGVLAAWVATRLGRREAPGRAEWLALALGAAVAHWLPAVVAYARGWQAAQMADTLADGRARAAPRWMFVAAGLTALAALAAPGPWGVLAAAALAPTLGGAVPLLVLRPLVALRAVQRHRRRRGNGARTLEGVVAAVGGAVHAPLSGREALAAVASVWHASSGLRARGATAVRVAREERTAPVLLQTAHGAYDLALDDTQWLAREDVALAPAVASPMLAPALARAGATDAARLLGAERVLCEGDAVAVLADVTGDQARAVVTVVDPRGDYVRGLAARAWTALALALASGAVTGWTLRAAWQWVAP